LYIQLGPFGITKFYISKCLTQLLTAFVVWWSEFLAANPGVPGSILGATRFSEYQWVWNRIQSAFVRISEEVLERKVATAVQKTEINNRIGSTALTTRHPPIHKSWH
jgi:hypothetical protein